MERTHPSPGYRRGQLAAARRTFSGAHTIAGWLSILLSAATASSPASAQKVRITNLSDVDFGLVTNLQADNRRTQSICLFSNGPGGAYSVTASGTGPAGSFALGNGSSLLTYEVEWSAQSGQPSGTSLTANGILSGQTSAATHQFCNSGPATSATVTIVLRANELSRAREGNYGGSLFLLIAAE